MPSAQTIPKVGRNLELLPSAIDSAQRCEGQWVYPKRNPNYQRAVNEAGGINGAKLLGAGWDAADKVGMEAAIAGGGTVTTLSDAELARWSEQISFMEADWIGRADARGLDGAALLEDLKATFSKFNN